MINLKTILLPFIIAISLISTNASATADNFEIVKIKTYESKTGLRSAKVTVKNIHFFSSIISSDDFVGITADGIKVRAKRGSSNRVESKETLTLMLNFQRQLYPIEEVEFY